MTTNVIGRAPAWGSCSTCAGPLYVPADRRPVPDRCERCRLDSHPPEPQTRKRACPRCGESMGAPDLTFCPGCYRPPLNPHAASTPQPAPSRCAGCETDTWGVADGYCMPCRRARNLDQPDNKETTR